MKTMTYTQTKQNLAQAMDAVVNDREEIVVTRNGQESVVIVSLEDYESLKETAYLLQNPLNSHRLWAAIERLEMGEGLEHRLSE